MQSVYNHNGVWVLTEEAGLDYESAYDATPQYFGVSFGNGNDGVSRTYPDYVVRCADPWKLARIATLGQFKPEYKSLIDESLEIDGEREYGVTGFISDDPTQEYEEDYENVNGAWFIVEVWPIDVESLGDLSCEIYESMNEFIIEAE